MKKRLGEKQLKKSEKGNIGVTGEKGRKRREYENERREKEMEREKSVRVKI